MENGGGTPRSTRTTILMVLIALLTVSIPLYMFLPLSDPVLETWYNATAGSAVLVGFLGLRWHRPQHRTGWFLTLLGFSGWLLGDVVWAFEQRLIPEHYPAPSDALYLSAYGLLGIGALMFVRTRRGRDLPALLDASIITTGAAVLVSVFLIAPLASDSSLTLAGKVITSAYPLGDLFLIGVIARMYAAPGARTASYWLLSTALAVTLLTDLGWNLITVISGDPISTPLINSGWLIGYVLVAASASVPSMKALAEPGPTAAETAPSRLRLVCLGGGLMLPGIALLVDGATGGGVLWPVIGVGMLILSALVLVRMIGLLQVVQIQAVRLAALASSDALTGAPNRRTWDKELSAACAASRATETALSVAILDLDHFKTYNDTRGHQAGDRLLREAVAAWTEELPSGALLARYGGEEFAVLFPNTDPHKASRTLDRLRRVTPDGQTFSAGVAVWDPTTDPGTAIAEADEALYAAKRSGRDRIVVHSTGNPPAPGNPVLPGFSMVTQPIVDIATLAVTGHEALTRFEGAGNADVEAVFRRAHEGGYGDLLELAAIQAALKLPGRPAGHELYVNVSARALTSERFLADLPRQLAGVVIELNEDPDKIDPVSVAVAVAELRSRGATIALDDVGAGAEEFARLATLRPDVIKADRSLVDGCAHDPGRSAVLRALVTYANYLGVRVCAEGVEDVADLEHLSLLGVGQAQGYLLARPGTTWPNRVAVAPSADRPTDRPTDGASDGAVARPAEVAA